MTCAMALVSDHTQGRRATKEAKRQADGVNLEKVTKDSERNGVQPPFLPCLNVFFKNKSRTARRLFPNFERPAPKHVILHSAFSSIRNGQSFENKRIAKAIAIICQHVFLQLWDHTTNVSKHGDTLTFDISGVSPRPNRYC